jgi:membrane associated rhomboid family serine protease/tetratricopeptide (TPR) repeat protein
MLAPFALGLLMTALSAVIALSGFPAIGSLGLSVSIGLLLHALLQRLVRHADREPSGPGSGFPRVYRPAPATLKRQCRWLSILIPFFLIVPLWLTLGLLMGVKGGTWSGVITLDAICLPVVLFLIWAATKAMTAKVVLDSDALAVVNIFGQKRLQKADMAGARLAEGLFQAAEGTSLPWLKQKGALVLVPSNRSLRPLYLPYGVTVDPAFDEWVGGLAVLGSKSADASAVAAGTTIRGASANASGVWKAVGIPFVTIALLTVLGAVFVLEWAFPVGTGGGLQTSPPTLVQISTPTLVAFGGLNRALVLHQGEWFRILSSVFLHLSDLHLAMNGLVLLVAGFILERQIGRVWFLTIFIISGIGGSLMSITLNPPTVSVGASGAIMGLLAAALVITFRQSAGTARAAQRGRLLGWLIPALIPAASVKHIDVAAHLGGAIAGAMIGILIFATWRRELPLPRLRGLAAGIVVASLLMLPIGLSSGMAGAYRIRGAAAPSESVALADYDRAIAIEPKVAEPYNARGIIRFTEGQYDGAAADFQASMNLAPVSGYNTLLLHLARARAGLEDAAELSSNAARLDLRQWPGPIVALFLGKTALTAIPGMVMVDDERTRTDWKCQASFWMGEYEALHDQIAHATQLIRQAAADDCPDRSIEHKLAKAELSRLGSIGGQQEAAVPPAQTPPPPAPAPSAVPDPRLSVGGLQMRARETSAEIPPGQNTDADKVLIEKFANFFLPVAKTFGCQQFAWGSFVKNHNNIQLEYVPEGDDVRRWTRLIAITLYPLPKDTASQIKAMTDIRGHLLSVGKLLDQTLYVTKQGYPGLFIEYEIGGGIQKEHSAGAFMTSLPDVASFIQIQSRGKPFDQADAANMKLFAHNKLPLAQPDNKDAPAPQTPPVSLPAQPTVSPSGSSVAELVDRAKKALADKNYSDAMRWYRMAADQGDAAAQLNVGGLYHNGWGVPQNYPEAMQWFRKAAAQGNPAAQNDIGILFANGRGVPKDYAEAMRWYRMAAAQGFALAQTNIGFLYEDGSGVSLDYAEAMRWFRMAAAQGSADAQNKIGLLYQRGRGVSQNPVEAVRWFQMAAVQGFAPAQTNVGWMIARGDGAPKDCTAARQWFEKAAAAGNEGARSELSTGAKGACSW